MSEKPRYGELQSAVNPEACKIWRARNCEPTSEDANEIALWEPVLSAQKRAEERDAIFLAALPRLLGAMTCEQRNVLMHRFWLGCTLEEIAIKRRVTRERIRQLEQAALRRIRKLMGVPPSWSWHGDDA